VIVLGQRMIVEHGTPDLFKVALMLVTLAVIWTGRKIPEPLIVLAAALIGLVAYPMLH
jgi:chromate transporter